MLLCLSLYTRDNDSIFYNKLTIVIVFHCTDFAIQFNEDTPAVTDDRVNVSFSSTTPVAFAFCRINTQQPVQCNYHY